MRDAPTFVVYKAARKIGDERKGLQRRDERSSRHRREPEDLQPNNRGAKCPAIRIDGFEGCFDAS